MDEQLVIEEIRSCMDSKNYDRAEENLKEALKREPHSPVWHNLFGILLEKEHLHLLAMKHFRAAYDLDPTYAPAVFNLEHISPFKPNKDFAFVHEDIERYLGKESKW